jgi:hypothetical protein
VVRARRRHRAFLIGTLVLGTLASACAERARPSARSASASVRTPPAGTAIAQAALAAVAAAPWDVDPSGWGTLCTVAAPCDTLILDPRVVSLPEQAPAFFVPERRDAVSMLTPYALTLSAPSARTAVLGSWRECSARRDQPGWRRARVACVAFGVAGYETTGADAMTFALLVATPARGLSWPRVRVTRPRERWQGRLLSNASE